MAGEVSVDVDSDCCGVVLTESMAASSALLFESRSNAQNVHNIRRLSAVRKYNQEDPLEAAASAKILGK